MSLLKFEWNLKLLPNNSWIRLINKDGKHVEDIYFFEVNTKSISSSVLKTSEFTWVRSMNENFNVFNSWDEIYLVFTKKSKFSIYLILF